MPIDDDFLQELHSRIDIESVVSPYVNLKKRGSTMTGLCPFHNEKTPSFTVYPESASFYCFGCGAGGDVVTFVRRIENLDYVEAVKSLAQRAGMSFPEDGYDDSLSKKRMRILAANRAAAKFFNASLLAPEGKQALDYLLNRGIGMPTIKHFGLGFAPDSWDALIKNLQSEGFTFQELNEANLAGKSLKGDSERFYDRFRNRMMVPIIDLRGNVVAFGGRVLDDSKPKYINTSDTLVYKKGKDIFALCFAKNGNNGKLILTEGYMDAIALHQAGFLNAVAGLGTALTREQAKLLSHYADEIIISYDSDEAGQEATKKAIYVLGQTDLKIKVLQLSGGKDPDEIIRKFGKERFQSLIDGAANDIEFKLLREREKYDLQTSNGKLNFLRAVVVVLAQLDGAIERDIYASRLAEELSVDKNAIMSQINESRGKLIKSKKKDKLRNLQQKAMGIGDKINPEKGRNIRAAKAEETLISTLLNNPDFYEKIFSSIDADDFLTDMNKHIFEVLGKRLKNGSDIDVSLLSSELNDSEMSRMMMLKIQGCNVSNTVAECDDCIKVIFEEKDKQKNLNLADLTDDEYLKLFKPK